MDRPGRLRQGRLAGRGQHGEVLAPGEQQAVPRLQGHGLRAADGRPALAGQDRYDLQLAGLRERQAPVSGCLEARR